MTSNPYSNVSRKQAVVGHTMNENAAVFIAPEDPGVGTIEVPVLKVFDGDGFLTKVRSRDFTGNPWDTAECEAAVRFGFVDAPEMGQPGGREAKEFLTSLIAGQRLELAVLTKMDTGRSVDSYGRLVCVPYLKQDYAALGFRTSSSVFHIAKTFREAMTVTRNIELEMVLNGWAWVLERYGPDDRYFAALEDAQRHKRGIWAFENNIHPWEFKKQKYRNKQPNRPSNSFVCETCPQEGCGGHLIKRTGKYGPFMGCSNFPRCKYSCSSAEVPSFSKAGIPHP